MPFFEIRSDFLNPYFNFIRKNEITQIKNKKKYSHPVQIKVIEIEYLDVLSNGHYSPIKDNNSVIVPHPSMIKIGLGLYFLSK